MNLKTVTAIVPMKYNSSRVPGKNYRYMNGHPLYYYILTTLQKVPEIRSVIVNTDSKEITDMLTKDFPDILVYNRPENLCGDDVSTNKIIDDTIRSLDIRTDFILQTHVTNPLLGLKTIKKAIKDFSDDTEHDSLFGVTKHQTRIYSPSGKALNHDVLNLIPTQNLKPFYEENSCIYIYSRDVFNMRKSRIGVRPMLFNIPKIESQDIDWEEDFEITEILQRKILNCNKVVVITGASGGIGSEICKEFKKNGWVVLGTDIENPDHKNYHFFILGDISNSETYNKIKDVITSRLGSNLDCLVNNSATQICKDLDNTSDKEWDRTMSVNLKASFSLTRDLSDILKIKKGSVVNISSVHAIATSAGVGAYSVSKTALTGLTRTFAIELAKYGIRVNSVLPGATDTTMLREHLSDEDVDRMASKHPIGRIGKPSDISRMVYFLADDTLSGFITGQSMVVDGGSTIALSTEL